MHTEFFCNPCWGLGEVAAPKPKYALDSRFFLFQLSASKLDPNGLKGWPNESPDYSLFFYFAFFFFCSEFCHTLKWNSHGFTCVPHPDPPSHLNFFDFKTPKPLQEKKTIHSEGSCVLTSVFCGLSPSLTTKVVASCQVWVTPVTVLFTLLKPELKKRISWWGQQRVARLRTQYSFPRLVRINKLVPRLNEGRSETLQPYLIASGQSKEASWKCWVAVQKGTWGGGRKRQHPSITVGGEDMGKPWSPHQRPISEGSRGLQSMPQPQAAVEGGGRRIDGLEGGRHLRLRETRDAGRAPRTPAVPPRLWPETFTSTLRSCPELEGCFREREGRGEKAETPGHGISSKVIVWCVFSSWVRCAAPVRMGINLNITVLIPKVQLCGQWLHLTGWFVIAQLIYFKWTKN